MLSEIVCMGMYNHFLIVVTSCPFNNTGLFLNNSIISPSTLKELASLSILTCQTITSVLTGPKVKLPFYGIAI